MSRAVIVFKTADQFKRIYDITKALAMPVTIIPEEERILTMGIDAPKVVGIRISIPEEDLAEYEVDDDYLELEWEKKAICLDHKALNPVMKKAKKSEPLRIEVLDDGRVRVEAGDKRKTRVTVAPINYDLMQIPEEPFNMEYGGTIQLYGKLLKDVLSVVREVGDDIHIKVEEDGLRFWSENETTDLDVLIPYDDPQLVSVEAEVGTTGIYGTAYLLMISKSIQNGDLLTMEFGTEQPLKLDIPIGDKAVFTVLLAPRVSNEEE
jgi:DNA polymerase III sliding clamp (beta) subunit (PCNA family)